METYCSHARSLPTGNVHRDHHDTEHGFRAADDDDLFRRLILEISQAGLSFDIVLKKKKTIYSAFPSVRRVAAFSQKDIDRLMLNPGIIRNRLKILAAIENAKRIIEIGRDEKYGSFEGWLEYHSKTCKNRDDWTKLFKKTFKFTGGEIVNEFLMSTGYLPGAHDLDCVVGKKAKLTNK